MKMLVLMVIREKGFSKPYFTPRRQAMNGERYRNDVIRKYVKPFIDEHHADGNYHFWPDLASAHYAGETLELFENYGIHYIPRRATPPNVPHLRPIKNYWALLKRVVYSGGYVAKSMAALKQ